jgi:hypothetical protein
MQKEDDASIITEQFLMDRLGPAPTVSRVANFLEESASTTWRRLKDHQLLALKGAGTTRVNLRSLVHFLMLARITSAPTDAAKKQEEGKQERKAADEF